MRIAVCLKEVVDTTLPLRVSPRDGAITQQSGDEPIKLINPSDRVALDVAMNIRAEQPGSRVEAFSVCEPDKQSVLHFALARGADAAQRIPVPTELSGPPATAAALASRFVNDEFDLICCGDETLDNSAAAVGPLIAELLGHPVVARVNNIRSLDRKTARVERRLERSYRELVEVQLPAVWTLSQDATQPQYVSRGRLERSRKKDVPSWDPANAPAAHLPLWPEQEKTVPPRARVKKKFIPDSSIKGTDRMKMMMGETDNQSQQSSDQDTILEGDADYLSEQLFRFLKHHEFV